MGRPYKYLFDESHGQIYNIPFDKNPNAIIPNFYPECIFITFELFYKYIKSA